jgi:serine phosphatase RsbU (regulator of sigma subunit)/pSer/pThr/pTyr-binding forkhead associated (FHA) protein
MNNLFVIRQQDGTVKTLQMDTNHLSLGRSADNDLAYPDDSVLSRHHLVFERDGDDWSVEDLGSKNGTLVNDARLTGRRKLNPGDRVVAGHVSILLQDPKHSLDQTVVFVPEETAEAGSISTNLTKVVGPGANGLESALLSPQIAGTPRMQALLSAGRELDTNRPLPELFQVILDLAVNSVGASRGVVITVEGDNLVPRAARGESFHISRTARDRVLERKESLLIADASQDAALRASHTIVQQNVRSLMAVPLQTKDSVIGLIYVDSPDILRPFTPDDLTLLTVMANIAAIRIENARLAEVEERQRLLRKELEQAAEIQRSLLPKSPPQIPGIELAGLSLPCRSVGGDYYDYLQLSGGRIGVLCGDVAGKGMSAALLMANLQARVQLLAEEDQDLATLMTRLNRSLAVNCPSNRFITLFLAICDPATGALWYSNAGHNPPFLLRENGAVETLTTGGPMLGPFKNFQFQASELRFDAGDVLVMFSDGVSEAQNARQEEFGEDRLLDLLKASRHLPAQEITREIYEAAERFMGEAPAADDITIVVARRV